MKRNYFEAMQLGKKGYGRAMESVCRQWDLTQNELNVLLFLANNPGFDRAADLVTHRGMTKSHVSLSVTNLESRGLLLRRADPQDRRTVHLELTEESREIARAGREVQRAYFGRLFRGLSREELDIWQEVMEKVCRNMEQMETE